MSLVSFSDVTRFHNRQDVLRGVTLSIEPGERIGLVGRNGAGKTTIIRLIMGQEAPDGGQVSRAKGLRLGYLPQDIMAQADQALLGMVLDTDPEFRRVEGELREIEEKLAATAGLSQGEQTALADRHGHLLERFEAMDGWGRESEAKKVLSGLGFQESDFQRSLSEFSGGWVMRAVLARLLVSKPGLLVLDEPTNHLDIDSLMWLEGYLKGSPSALLLVSHDRVFLNNVAQRIVELRQGRADSYPGDYDQFLEEKARRLATESAAYANQQDRIRQMEKFIERNRVRASTARRAQSRVKALGKMDRLSQPDDGAGGSISLSLPRGRRGPDVVAELKGVSKSYGRTRVYEDLSLTLLRGDRLALVGPNGRGKSTLVKLLAGLTAPSSGLLRLGQNVDLGYFSQFQMESLNPGLTILEELAKVAGHLTQGPLRTILGGFLFHGEDVFKKVSVLSGGEKTRLVLCKIMMAAPNLLIMDEPTNHLDIPGRQMLEDALDDYAGTMVLISHDRHFINRLCDKIGVIEDGRLIVHPGDFDDYQRLWLSDPSSISGQDSPSPLGQDGNGPQAGPDKAGPAKEGQDKAERPGGRRQAAQDRKRQAALRRPLEKRLEETEKRISEIAGRTGELEASLCDRAVYQDGRRAKDLRLELAGLYEEKRGLETVWEATALELETVADGHG
ncbi:MAG: ABC-F family ATP-binding cassette domain-containing protein [Deltaproteobacteria bacterium]|jgi:ATP-binding cassette subfamily F protein 3|nr:ABC-F family ATP-binding cassette domain-containing protein [Deltaproteobacteria bacterium]